MMQFSRTLTLNVMAIALALGVSTQDLEAATIAVGDWWLQTDSLGGLRQSTTNDQFYFAVSQSTIWSPGDIYEAPTGYRVATTSEGEDVFNQGNSSGIHTYYNQGGWTGYQWDGATRYFFRFSDSDVTAALKHAGNYDEYHVQYATSTSYFAGMVLVRDLAAVPLPAALPLFLAGLAGLGFAARRRSAV